MNNEDEENKIKELEELRKLIRKLKMLKTIYISSITTLSIGALIWALVDYSTLPVVAFNQAGQCVYIETEQGRKACGLIPNKYIMEQVQ